MIFGIILGILILLCLIPLGIRAVYSSDGFKLWLLAGPIRILLSPRKKKGKEKKEAPKKEKKSQTKKTEKNQESKEGGSIRDFLPIVDVAKRLLLGFFKKHRIRRLDLRVTLAGDDPCDLAVNYGRAWAATGNLIPLLEERFVIKKRDVQIECDFTAEETKVYAAADITILTGRLISLVAVHGYQALREFLKLQNKRKGEHQNESESS